MRDAAVNGGHLCAKGRYAHAYHRSADRLTQPLLRRGDDFEAVGWDEALRWLAERLNALRARHGPTALGALTSSRSTNASRQAWALRVSQSMRNGVGGVEWRSC